MFQVADVVPSACWTEIRAQAVTVLYVRTIKVDKPLRLFLTLEEHFCPPAIRTHYSVPRRLHRLLFHSDVLLQRVCTWPEE